MKAQSEGILRSALTTWETDDCGLDKSGKTWWKSKHRPIDDNACWLREKSINNDSKIFVQSNQ